MSNAWGPLPDQKTSRTPKWWLLVAVVVVLLIVLLVFVPLLVFLLSIVAIIVGLIALALGRIRWARIANRKSAAGVIGGAFALFIVSTIVFGLSLPTETSKVQPFADTAASAPTQEPTLASYVDQPCEADHLVMTQGGESNYCDKNDSGAFIWVGQMAHDQAVAKAAERAEKKAAAEAKAKEEAAKKKAAAKKAAQEKAAAEAKAKKEAERKEEAAAAAKEAAAEQAAVDAAARELAEQRAEAESFTEDTAGSSAYYANCTAVRAAGAAPIYSGDPGYSRKLDRDGDGVGCES